MSVLPRRGEPCGDRTGQRSPRQTGAQRSAHGEARRSRVTGLAPQVAGAYHNRQSSRESATGCRENHQMRLSRSCWLPALSSRATDVASRHLCIPAPSCPDRTQKSQSRLLCHAPARTTRPAAGRVGSPCLGTPACKPCAASSDSLANHNRGSSVSESRGQGHPLLCHSRKADFCATLPPRITIIAAPGAYLRRHLSASATTPAIRIHVGATMTAR